MNAGFLHRSALGPVFFCVGPVVLFTLVIAGSTYAATILPEPQKDIFNCPPGRCREVLEAPHSKHTQFQTRYLSAKSANHPKTNLTLSSLLLSNESQSLAQVSSKPFQISPLSRLVQHRERCYTGMTQKGHSRRDTGKLVW